MMKTNRDEYDVIVSLGGSCSTAAQLRHRGKRPYSLPLDWTLMSDDRPIRALPELFRTRFRDFCRRENMTEFEKMGDEYGVRKYHLEDNRTGYRIIHHFTVLPTDEIGYDAQRDILMRRVERLYSRIEGARNVLFAINTAFPYDPILLEPVLKALNETLPGRDIDIVAMQFAAGKSGLQNLQGGKIRVMFIERPLDIVYDNWLTAPEWNWMDRVRISGLPLPEETRKRKLLVKWAYKLWRTLGKHLENKGAGCANMRFYRFRYP